METQSFWNVIGEYNSQTRLLQVIIWILLTQALLISYFGKYEWLAKLAIGNVCLYIGIVYFWLFGEEPIQIYFALPLYLGCGTLFIYEAFKNKDDKINRFNKWQIFLLVLCSSYPFVSMLLGNSFPQMLTYIMPCPVVSLSIVVYSSYQKKNLPLLILLSAWGLTGVKSFMFNAYEDIILLICGFYGVYCIYKELKSRQMYKKIGSNS